MKIATEAGHGIKHKQIKRDSTVFLFVLFLKWFFWTFYSLKNPEMWHSFHKYIKQHSWIF